MVLAMRAISVVFHRIPKQPGSHSSHREIRAERRKGHNPEARLHRGIVGPERQEETSGVRISEEKINALVGELAAQKPPGAWLMPCGQDDKRG